MCTQGDRGGLTCYQRIGIPLHVSELKSECQVSSEIALNLAHEMILLTKLKYGP